LGVVDERDFVRPPATVKEQFAAYPSLPSLEKKLPKLPFFATSHPLPLRLTETPPSVAARAASIATVDPYLGTTLQTFGKDGQAVEDYHITRRDWAQIYVSPHAYHDGFDIELNLLRYKKEDPTAGMRFRIVNGRLILDRIEKSTIAAKIPRWRSRLRNAWLRRIGDVEVSSVADVKKEMAKVLKSNAPSCWLTFSHPEIAHGLTNDGIPQINVGQLNPRHLFDVGELNLATPPTFPLPDIGAPAAAAATVRTLEDGGGDKCNLLCLQTNTWQAPPNR